MQINSFRDLQVWQKSMRLVEDVYTLTEHFPRAERFGLTAQLRRAAVSIASNIAEGHAKSTGYYLNHLNIAVGSQAEVQTYLELAHRLRFVEVRQVEPLLAGTVEIARMLHALRTSIEQRRRGPNP